MKEQEPIGNQPEEEAQSPWEISRQQFIQRLRTIEDFWLQQEAKVENQLARVEELRERIREADEENMRIRFFESPQGDLHIEIEPKERMGFLR